MLTSFTQAVGLVFVIGVIVALMYAVAVAAVYFSPEKEGEQGRLLPQMGCAGLLGGVAAVVSAALVLLTSSMRFVGPYGSIRWYFLVLMLTTLIPGLICLSRSFTDYRSDRYWRYSKQTQRIGEPFWHGTGIASVLFLTLAVLSGLLNTGLAFAQTVNMPGGPSKNGKEFAALANISYNNGDLPPTDVHHIIQVTQGMASYAAQQVIGASGHNWGSVYHFDQNEFTLQAIKGHLYWVAPMEISQWWNQIFDQTTPGFVSVDAEDAAATAVLHTDQALHYVTSKWWAGNVTWETYYRGYNNTLLSDWTLEVDDNWHPYWTADMEHPTKAFYGNVIDGAILLDAISGHVATYKIGQQPEWVDRVVPQDYVQNKVSDWGTYHFTPAHVTSQAGRQQIGGNVELVYNTADHPVWMVPMTSASVKDSSSTGVIVYSSQAPNGLYYHVSGIAVGDIVTKAFQSNPHNIRNYHVSYTQLYVMDGVPTYLCIFAQDNDYGESFQALGLMDARHPNGAYVVMAQNLQQALTAYGQELQVENANGNTATSNVQVVTLKAQVTRISAPITSGNTTIYEVRVKGSSITFQISTDLDTSAVLPLTQPGDLISLSYLDTGQGVDVAKSFVNLSL